MFSRHFSQLSYNLTTPTEGVVLCYCVLIKADLTVMLLESNAPKGTFDQLNLTEANKYRN